MRLSSFFAPFTALSLSTMAVSAAAPVPGVSFTPNLHLISSASSPIFAQKDVEPEIRVDTAGRIFVSAIHGVPGGTDLFQIATSGLAFTYRGEPDGLPRGVPPTGLAPGGGDTDLAIGSFNSGTTGVCRTSTTCPPGPLLITSLNLATVYTSQTSDSGMTYTPGANAAGVPVALDREWNNAFGGLERYNVVHDIATGNIQFARSLDGGLTWVNGTPTNTGDANTAGASANNNEIGPIVVDQNHLPNQILYEVFVSDASPAENATGVALHTVYVARSTNDGLTWTDTKVWNGPIGPTYNHLFPSLAVDAMGHLFAVWSDDHDVFMAYSYDNGATWHGKNGALIGPIASAGAKPIQVTNGLSDGGFKTHLMPWIAAGFNGGVDIVYYETTGANASLATDAWYVGMAQNIHVLTAPNQFVYYTPSDHAVHHGQICENGIGCDSTQPGNRNLADDFQVAVDMNGLANITYTDDHLTTFSQPQVFFTKQKFGYNVGTPNGAGPNRGCVAYGTTLPTANQAGGVQFELTVKKPQAASQGWLTLDINHVAVSAGRITTYNATSIQSGTFRGVTRTNLPFSATIANNAVTLTVGTKLYKGTLTRGTFVL